MDTLKHCTAVHRTTQNIKSTLKQSLFSFLKQHILYLSSSHPHTPICPVPSLLSRRMWPPRPLQKVPRVCVCMSVISSARWQLWIFDLPHTGLHTHTSAIHGIWWSRTHTHSTNRGLLEDNLISETAVGRWDWATVANTRRLPSVPHTFSHSSHWTSSDHWCISLLDNVKQVQISSIGSAQSSVANTAFH